MGDVGTWEECFDNASGRPYYVNRTTGESSWTLPSGSDNEVANSSSVQEVDAKIKVSRFLKAKKSTGGLSELAKQLRHLQAKSEQQKAEIKRLERENRIAADMKGVDVRELQNSLRKACEKEAYGELQRTVAILQNQLVDAESRLQEESSSKFVAEAAAAKVASLELRLGEREEVEQTLRAEVSDLYSRLSDARAVNATADAELVQLRSDVQTLEAEKATASAGSTAKEDRKAKVARLAQAKELRDLRGRVSTLKASADSAALRVEQLGRDNREFELKCEQQSARFRLQDERIVDLEQQLSSLYVVFDLLQKEHASERERFNASQFHLTQSDSQLAISLEKEEKDRCRRRDGATSATAAAAAVAVATPISQASSNRVEGWLFKRGGTMRGGGISSKFVGTAWKKRWATFEVMVVGGERKGVLSYYEKPRGKMKGRLFVDHNSSVRMIKTSEESYSQRFELATNPTNAGSPLLVAATETPAELETWLYLISRCIADSNLQTSGSRESSTFPSSQTQEEQEKADRELALRLAYGDS